MNQTPNFVLNNYMIVQRNFRQQNIMKLSKYDIVKQIGQGQFGQIFLAKERGQHQLQEQFAVKEIDGQHGEAELMLLPSINHPNIIHVHEIIKNNNGISIVMEYASKGDLSAFVKKQYPQEYVPQKIIRSWLLQLSLALYYLHHELCLVHRDIKMINVLVMENGLIKLSDFGLAKKMNSQEDYSKSTVGTPYYLSPETVNQGRFNIKSDVWGLGCLLYELCSGQKPFKGTAYGQIFNNIVNKTIDQIPGCYSKWLSELIRSLLQKNGQKRPTVQAILEDQEMRKEFVKLKATYKEYEGFTYPELNLRTTKYLDREERMNENMRMFSESLKTAKKEKAIKMRMQDSWGEAIKNKQKKVERVKFANKSLRSLLAKSQQQQLTK